MTKAAIWNQLKSLGYDAKQLKLDLGTYAQVTKDQLESILEQLQKEVGQGVKEDLSTECGGVTGNEVNQDKTPVNYIVTLADYPQVVIKDDYTAKDLTEVTEQQLVDSLYTDKVTAETMFPGSYYQVLEVNPVNIRQELLQHFNTEVIESVWNYKIVQSSWHPDFYHIWMYEGEKSYYYFHTDNMVAEIKLQDLETKVNKLNSLASTKSVTVQSCGTWSNIFTCNDMELKKLLASQYYQLNRDKIMKQSLTVAEIHTQAIKQQDLLKQWQLEQDSSVATETNDNITEFKGIPVEHVTCDDIGLDYPKTTSEIVITMHQMPTVTYFLVDNSEDVLQFNSLVNAVKQASEWLGVNTVKVPSTEEAIQPFDYSLELTKLKSLSRQEFMALIQEVQHVKHFSSYYLPKWEVVETYFTKKEYELATKVEQAENDDDCHWLKLVDIQDCFTEAGNYHYQQMQLNPKLELFSAMIEFVYLANCFTYLLGELTRYNQQWNKLISNFSSSVFETWYSINGVVHKSYIPQPLPTHNDYVTMLQLLQ